MSVGDQLEALLPAARGGRLALRAGLLVLAAVAIAFVLWWVLWRPRAAQVEKAEARVEAATATGTAGAATDAMKIQIEVAQTRGRIDIVTQENDRAIHAASGAGESVGGDLDRAGRAALCLRAAYRADPGCAALRGPDGGIRPAGGNPAGGAAPR